MFFVSQLSIIVLLLTIFHDSLENEEVLKKQLETLILREVNKSAHYDFPQDNSDYFRNVDESEIRDFGSFDFIIIGSGSTGSVLANRLSSIRSWKILLLEAGGQDDIFTNIPSMYSHTLRSKNNWGYNTTSQKFGCKGMIGNRCSYPRGKIMGGSSSINGLIYTRGNPLDYEYWKRLGNIGWGYEDVEPYFKKIENVQFPGENLGHSGPLCVNFSSPISPLQKIFDRSLQEMGYLPTEYNGGPQIGYSRVESNIKRGRRVSGSNAYIRPILHRRNLNVTLHAFVTKILIDDKTAAAYGVRFIRNQRVYEAFAKKEVILSAGAVNSPQILMLSGIGPSSLLNKYNIPIIQELPVGETLIDQIAYNLQFASNFTQALIPLSTQVLDYLKGEGMLTSPFNGKSLSFIKPDSMGRPSVEFVLLPPTGGNDYGSSQISSPYIDCVNEAYVSKINPHTFFSITIILLHPKSTGTVSIDSSSPVNFPLIDSNIFSDESDKKSLYEAIKFAIELTETEPFRNINASVFSPIPPCFKYPMYSEKYWYCAIEYMALPTYHSTGTTLMGSDSTNSVVGKDLKVHGIGNLRIADCGVIPSLISGHTNGPAFMIGEKVSSMIKKDYKLRLKTEKAS